VHEEEYYQVFQQVVIEDLVGGRKGESLSFGKGFKWELRGQIYIIVLACDDGKQALLNYTAIAQDQLQLK
jgi:hypothetical protein